MLEFLSRFSGEKIREALWIICIIILFAKCAFFQYCPESPMMYTLVGAMFTDLVGATVTNTITKIKSNTKTT